MAIDSKDLLMAVKAFSRANPLPLDASEIHSSVEAAEVYAASAKAYAGQTIKVLQDGKYETYVLNPKEQGSGLALEKALDTSKIKTTVQVVETLPASGQEQGVIYIDSSLTGYVWTGTNWKILFEQIQLVDENGEASTVTPSQAIANLNSEVDALQEIVDTLTGDGQGSIDYKISEAMAKADHLKRQVVTELPQEGISDTTIYMMLNGETGDDIYDEWMYLEGAWEKLGRTTVDLTGYYTKTEAHEVFATLVHLDAYAKKTDIPTQVSQLTNDAGYLVADALTPYALKTEIPSLDDYALKTEIPSLNGYATEEYVQGQIEAIEIPSLDGYATEEYVKNFTEGKDYATKAYVAEAIANLEGGGEIDLTGYVTQEQFNAKIGTLGDYSSVVEYVDAKTLNVVVFE